MASPSEGRPSGPPTAAAAAAAAPPFPLALKQRVLLCVRPLRRRSVGWVLLLLVGARLVALLVFGNTGIQEAAGTLSFSHAPDPTDQHPQSHPMEFDGLQPRAFPLWRDRDGNNGSTSPALPCFSPRPDWRYVQHGPTTNGFVFVKPIKTGSSTAAGINLRVARNVAHRLYLNEIQDFLRQGGTEQDLPPRYTMCKTRSEHVPEAHGPYRKLDRQKSFLWTVIRNPTDRAVSLFFHFRVSRGKVEPSDALFESFLGQGAQRHYYLRTLSLRKVLRVTANWTGADSALSYAQGILDDYDFVGVTERMDESLVALSMLLRVPLADVLYLKAKGRGGWDDGRGTDPLNKTCTYIWPSFSSPGMRRALESPEWGDSSRWDAALHRAANRSLDLTIDRTLGREAFAAKLVAYRNALAAARERCAARAAFPCTAGGQYRPPNETDCLWLDSGCGAPCLDEVARDLQLEIF